MGIVGQAKAGPVVDAMTDTDTVSEDWLVDIYSLLTGCDGRVVMSKQDLEDRGKLILSCRKHPWHQTIDLTTGYQIAT